MSTITFENKERHEEYTFPSFREESMDVIFEPYMSTDDEHVVSISQFMSLKWPSAFRKRLSEIGLYRSFYGRIKKISFSVVVSERILKDIRYPSPDEEFCEDDYAYNVTLTNTEGDNGYTLTLKHCVLVETDRLENGKARLRFLCDDCEYDVLPDEDMDDSSED